MKEKNKKINKINVLTETKGFYSWHSDLKKVASSKRAMSWLLVAAQTFTVTVYLDWPLYKGCNAKDWVQRKAHKHDLKSTLSVSLLIEEVIVSHEPHALLTPDKQKSTFVHLCSFRGITIIFSQRRWKKYYTIHAGLEDNVILECLLEPLTSSNLFAKELSICGQCLFPFHGYGVYRLQTWWRS